MPVGGLALRRAAPVAAPVGVTAQRRSALHETPRSDTAVFPPREAPDGVDSAAVDALVTRQRGSSRGRRASSGRASSRALVSTEASTIVVAPDSRTCARARRRSPTVRPAGDRRARGTSPTRERTESWDRAATPARRSSWAGGSPCSHPFPTLPRSVVLDEGDEGAGGGARADVARPRGRARARPRAPAPDARS